MKGRGGVVLYATKACAAQLTAKHKLSVTIVEKGRDGDLYVVQAKASNGLRDVEDIGAVEVSRCSGEALANAMMKATTKAKRRAVLTFCGLGEIDESEVGSAMRAREARQPERVEAEVIDAPEP